LLSLGYVRPQSRWQLWGLLPRCSFRCDADTRRGRIQRPPAEGRAGSLPSAGSYPSACLSRKALQNVRPEFAGHVAATERKVIAPPPARTCVPGVCDLVNKCCSFDKRINNLGHQIVPNETNAIAQFSLRPLSSQSIRRMRRWRA